MLALHKCSWAVLAVRRVILLVRAACAAGVALVQTHSCSAAACAASAVAAVCVAGT
jgi:hypothetical protein